MSTPLVGACSRPERFCKASSAVWYQLPRLIGEQTKPVVGRFPSSSCLPSLAFVASPLLCQPPQLQRPGEWQERDGRERKELEVPLRDIRLRIVCQREDMWRGSRGAGCSTSANPRAAAPRPAPFCDGATSHGATYSQHTGSRPGSTGRQSCCSRLVAPPGGGTLAPAPALSTSCGLCGVSNPFFAEPSVDSVVADEAS